MADKRQIKVFIASPGDLVVERRAFKTVIDELNKGFGDGRNEEFIPLGWEDILATAGRRPQSVINAEISLCDVFVLAMHARWGQEAPDSEFSSYTEEEFHCAFNRWRKEKSPEIFVFFKRVPASQEADPGVQLQKVMAFRRQLEESRAILYHYVDDKKGFEKELDRHLRAFARGDLPKADALIEPVVFPIQSVERIRKAEEVAKKEAERAEKADKRADAAAARADEFALMIAQSAAKAAMKGRIEEARQDLARAADGTRNLDVLYLAWEFYRRIGDLAEAELVMERSLAISGPDTQTAETAAYSNLSVISQIRGDLDRAEELLLMALDIAEKLGFRGGMAIDYGNLGVIYQTRGDLERAEEMHRKALEINEKLGLLEGKANQYANLGLIYYRRGDLDRAEEMHREALEIDVKLERLEGIANQYGNLGLIYQTRGDLDRAEEMHHKALEIDEKLGLREGMAAEYGNLGVLYKTRGDLDRAEEMYRKALEIDEELGRMQGIADEYGNLGVVFKTRGDLNRAEEMFRKALEIDEKLGRLEGMGNAYGNLGNIYCARSERDRAREYWTKARDLYARIGMPHKVETVQGLLDGLPPEPPPATRMRK